MAARTDKGGASLTQIGIGGESGRQSMFGRNRQSVNQSAWATAGVMIEAIEPRRMLSAGGSAVLAGDLVTITGTRRADTIVVAVNANDSTKVDVTNKGTLLGQFDRASVARVEVFCRGGNDTVTIDDA